MNTIVALVDFSDLTFKVLKQVHVLAEGLQSHVVLLHVVPREPVVLDFGLASTTLTRKPNPEEIEQDNQQLQDLCKSLTGGGVKASAQQLQASHVDDILKECRRLNADLIVVGSHHHGALYDLIIGGVTKDVLKQAFCPVLVIPDI